MNIDLHDEIHAAVAIVPQVQTNSDAAIVGQIVDMAGYSACEIVFQTGTLTDADAVFAVTLEHGNDPALADTSVPAATDLFGSLAGAGFTFANDIATTKLGYRGNKRYIRATVTPTGNNAGAAPIAAVAVMVAARKGPVS